METLQTFDEQEHHGKPDRTTPVAVATEHAGLRVVWPVGNTVGLAVDVHAVRVLAVVLGQRSDAVFAEELSFIQHSSQDAAQAFLRGQSQQATFSFTGLCSLGKPQQ